MFGCEVARFREVLVEAERLDKRIVPNQFRRPLIGVAAKKTVETLESQSQRPLFERPRTRTFTARDQMPFADRQRAPPGVTQQSWERGRRARNACGIARMRGGQIGEETHADRIVVAAGQQ